MSVPFFCRSCSIMVGVGATGAVLDRRRERFPRFCLPPVCRACELQAFRRFLMRTLPPAFACAVIRCHNTLHPRAPMHPPTHLRLLFPFVIRHVARRTGNKRPIIRHRETIVDVCNGHLLQLTAVLVPFDLRHPMQSPLPLVNAHADELVEFLLHILGSAEAEMNLKDSSALVRAGQVERHDFCQQRPLFR